MAGAIIMQSAVGFFLSLGASDGSEGEGKEDNADYAISFLLMVSLSMLAVVARWWSGMKTKEDKEGGIEGGEAGAVERERGRGRAEDEYGLLEPGAGDSSDAEESPRRGGREEVSSSVEEGRTRLEEEELRRGRRAMRAAMAFVALSWVCFVVSLFR
jgi:hypothetical protein